MIEVKDWAAKPLSVKESEDQLLFQKLQNQVHGKKATRDETSLGGSSRRASNINLDHAGAKATFYSVGSGASSNFRP